jgi:hypothetical protein
MVLKPVTAEDLYATSTKKQCEDARQHYIDLGMVEEYDSVRRHPDTCLSRVLTLAEADALWERRHESGSLLGPMGMCIYGHGPVGKKDKVFLTDDSSYGSSVLTKAGWRGMCFPGRGTAYKLFDTWREHVEHFYGKDVEVIETVEGLLKALNGGMESAAA